MRVGPGKFKKYVLIRSYYPGSKFPVPAGMATDQGHIRKTFGEGSDIHRRGFSRSIVPPRKARTAAHFHPGMDVDNGVKFLLQPDDAVVVGMIDRHAKFISTRIFNSYTRTLADPVLYFSATLFRQTGINRS